MEATEQNLINPVLGLMLLSNLTPSYKKTKRIYQDSRAQDNLTKLNEDLQDVTRIMTKNMEDLLWRGDSLDKMSALSDQLRDSSIKYRKNARNLNWNLLYRKYGIPALVLLLVFLVLLFRYFIY